MEYNYRLIGKRIRQEREAAGLTQAELIDILNQRHVRKGRNSISAIENGKADHFYLDLLVALCGIFNCELGYLLGEYEERTRTVTDICYETGLSPAAVQTLRALHADNTHTAYCDVISAVLESSSLNTALYLTASAISSRKTPDAEISQQTATITYGDTSSHIVGRSLIDAVLCNYISQSLDNLYLQYSSNNELTPAEVRAQFDQSNDPMEELKKYIALYVGQNINWNSLRSSANEFAAVAIPKETTSDIGKLLKKAKRKQHQS